MKSLEICEVLLNKNQIFNRAQQIFLPQRLEIDLIKKIYRLFSARAGSVEKIIFG